MNPNSEYYKITNGNAAYDGWVPKGVYAALTNGKKIRRYYGPCAQQYSGGHDGTNGDYDHRMVHGYWDGSTMYYICGGTTTVRTSAYDIFVNQKKNDEGVITMETTTFNKNNFKI